LLHILPPLPPSLPRPLFLLLLLPLLPFLLPALLALLLRVVLVKYMKGSRPPDVPQTQLAVAATCVGGQGEHASQ